jgi:hypothetical protein
MELLIAAAGVTIVALIGVDIALTVLHPGRRGPVTHRVNRVTDAVEAA